MNYVAPRRVLTDDQMVHALEHLAHIPPGDSHWDTAWEFCVRVAKYAVSDTDGEPSQLSIARSTTTLTYAGAARRGMSRDDALCCHLAQEPADHPDQVAILTKKQLRAATVKITTKSFVQPNWPTTAKWLETLVPYAADDM